ncbi:MAG: response regulator [Desulfovibrio sp.]
MKLLLIDDELRFSAILKRRFEQRGISVLTAADAVSGISLLSQQQIDVIILDVKMPGMDGLSALSYIKANFPLSEVIMLTGHCDPGDAMCGMESGAFDYMMKPADFDELLLKVKDAYDHVLLNLSAPTQ